MNRKELQSEAVELIKNNNYLILEWCTGTGKSKAAVDIINYLSDEEFKTNSSALNVLLIVAESAHKTNWNEEFKKWKLNTDNIIIECYASLKNYSNTFWDLVIFDEAHHLNTDKRLEIFNSMNIRHGVFLSATLPEQLKDVLMMRYPDIKTSKVSLNQAITHNILSEPKVFLIPLYLDTVKINQTIVEEWGKKKLRKRVFCNMKDRWKYKKDKKSYPNMELHIRCTESEAYYYICNMYEYWKRVYFRSRRIQAKNKWLQYGSVRKRFLGSLKTDISKRLINKIKGHRFICFCTNIEQADILGKEKSIHSNNKKSLEVLKKFNDYKIDELYAVGMLQEGQNLNGIEAGIIIQLDNAERAFIQKFGRTMRAEDPVQFILYYKNTRDEEYLNNILESINSSYIKTIENINEIHI